MRIEKGFFIAFLFALFMKFMNWPMASVVLIVALGSLSLFYFPLGFYTFSDKSIKQRLGFSLAASFLLCPVPFGILFKLNYWPGSTALLTMASCYALLLLAIVIPQRNKALAEHRVYYNRMLARSIVASFLSLLFLFTTSATLIKLQHRDDPELARLKILCVQNPGNATYQKMLDAYIYEKDPSKVRVP